MKQLIPQYVKALCQEIGMVSSQTKSRLPVGTIFFGGGTPSLFLPEQIERILTTAKSVFDVRHNAEITIEANPGTLSLDWLERLRSMGINRISIGMQSAHVEDLRVLDRQHDPVDIIKAVEWSKKARFEHINLDVIFGIPGQTLDRWRNTLESALRENVDHFSLYSLTIEDDTPLKYWIERGLIQLPDDDQAAEMYEYACKRLAAAGYIHYEISNWAQNEEAQCKHNLQYWRFLPYFGFGAGAHGFIDGIRTVNESQIQRYIDRITNETKCKFPAGKAAVETIRLSKWEQIQEYLMVGFRLTEEGVSLTDFQARFSENLNERFKDQIDLLFKLGFLEFHPDDDDHIRLTSKGMLFGNRVFREFVGNEPPEGMDQ